MSTETLAGLIPQDTLAHIAACTHAARFPKLNSKSHYPAISTPLTGSFNIVYPLFFPTTGTNWLLRIPLPNKNGNWVGKCRRIENEVLTMEYVRSKSKMLARLVPQVIGWSDGKNGKEVPYMVIEVMQGKSVGEVWFAGGSKETVRRRRERILASIAEVAMEFRKLGEWDKCGMLEFNRGTGMVEGIGAFTVYDEISDMLSPHTTGVNYRHLGPYRSTKSFLSALLYLRHPRLRSLPEFESSSHSRVADAYLLRMLLEAMPEPKGREKFTLSPPDFHEQNILLSDDGRVTALIDWDTVQTLPATLSYTRLPGFLCEDWDIYTPDEEADDSGIEAGEACEADDVSRCSSRTLRFPPENVEYWRKFYLNALRAQDPSDPGLAYTPLSHYYTALHTAAQSPLQAPSILVFFRRALEPSVRRACEEDFLEKAKAKGVSDIIVPEYTVEEVLEGLVKGMGSPDMEGLLRRECVRLLRPRR